MKYSQLIGIILCGVLIGICYMPLVALPGNIIITGFETAGTNFGKPGMMHQILCIVMIIFFALPKGWAKRTNFFIAAINLAWAIRNFILLSGCMAGECPEKKWGLYLELIISTAILAMSLLPKMKAVGEEK